MEWIAIAQWVVPWLIAGGAAYGGTKQALNGTRERVMKLEASDSNQNDKLSSLGEGMARVETKIDMLILNDQQPKGQ